MTDSFSTESFFRPKKDRMPHLLSIYQANNQYLKLPRVMHKHDQFLEIMLITKGCGIHTIDSECYYTETGDLLIYNPGIIHDECVRENMDLEVYTCAVDTLQLKGLKPNQLLADLHVPVIKTCEFYSHIHSLMEMIHRTISEKNPWSEEYADRLLQALLTLVIGIIHTEDRTYTKKEHNLAKDIKSYIDLHCLEDISLASIAGDLHLSVYYLSHIFKKIYGYSPIQYIMRRRIGEAQSLLLDTTNGITEIATTVGYNNSNYFHNAFTKVTGLSPQKYRKFYKKCKLTLK